MSDKTSAVLHQPQPVMANVDAECEIIAGLIAHPHLIDSLRLEPNDFFDAGCREVFSTLRHMQDRGIEIDAITLADTLPPTGWVAKAGGLAWIGDIMANALGAPTSLPRYAEIVRRYAADRRLAATSNQILDLAADRTGDTREKIARADELLSELSRSAVIAGETSLVYDQMESYLCTLEERQDQKFPGIPCGIAELDELIGGFQETKFYIIAGRPAMGKSSLALQIAKGCAQAKNTAYGEGPFSSLFLSQEMPKSELTDRLVSLSGSIELSRLLKGKLHDDDYTKLSAALSQIITLPLYINDKAALSLGDVRAFVRERRNDNLKVLVVDYLQLMQGQGDSRNAQIETISRGLKQIAMEFKLAVIALSQLSRDVEKRTDRRPINSDLRDSGAIEQDADVILMVYRDEVYKPDTQDKGIAEIIVTKQRAGPLGVVRTHFRGEYTRFDNYCAREIY